VVSRSLNSNVRFQKMTDFSKLIPELPKWNNGAGIDVVSWIGCVGDFEKAIGYSTIFWPKFVEIVGFIVREGTTKDNIKSFEKQCGGERKQIESLINHLHIRDIQYWECPGSTPERLAYLGKVLKETYECKLKRDFPDRQLVVELTEGDSEDLDGFMITFYQI
jgi:hypothetical protein